jgi:hypothetical protein
MKRINIPLILDSLFSGFCAFVLIFTAVRFYTKNIPLSLTLGITALILFGVLAFVYISKKQNKSLISSHTEKEKKLLVGYLTLSKRDELNSLAKAYFGVNCKISNCKIETLDCNIFYNFKIEALKADDVTYVIKHRGNKKNILLCNKISEEGEKLCASFDIEIFDIDKIYSLLKAQNLLPEKYPNLDTKKTNIIKRVTKRFNKKLCSPLFFSGISLLVLSYFTFFPLYYLIFGGVLLSLSVLALVKG